MGEPALKDPYDQEHEDDFQSARERAHRNWGMGAESYDSPGPDPDDEGEDADGQVSSAGSGGRQSARQRADQAWGMSPSAGGGGGAEAKEGEESGATPQPTAAETTEAGDVPSADTGGLFTRGSDNNIFGRFKNARKKVIIGGVTGATITAAIAGISILQGPLQIIQFSQLMDRFHVLSNNRFTNSRTMKLLRYSRDRNHPERRKLGYVMNRVADRIDAKWQRNGFKPIYELESGPSRGLLTGFEIDDDIDARPFLRENVRVEMGPNGKRVILMDDVIGSHKRDVTALVTKASDHNKALDAIIRRIMQKRGGVDFHPGKDFKRRQGQKLVDFYKERKKERAERRKRGLDPPNAQAARGDDNDADGDDIPDGDESPDISEAADEAAEGLEEITGTEIDGPDALARLRQSIAGRLAGGAAAAVGLICTARGLGNQAEEVQFESIVMPMLRMGQEMTSWGFQVMSGSGFTMDELGSISTDLYDKEAGKSWVAAKSIKAELKQKTDGAPDLPTYMKPGKVSEKPEWLEVLDSIPGIGAACGFSDFVSGLPVIREFGEVSSAFIERVLPFVDDLAAAIVGLLAGQGTNLYAQGAELGNIVNYGKRLTENDKEFGIGGQFLEASEEAQLDSETTTDVRAELQDMPLAERLFSVTSTESLVAKAIQSEGIPHSADQALSSMAALPRTLFSSLASFFTAISPLAHAQEDLNVTVNGYDYGFPMVGFTAAERDDPNNEPRKIAEDLDAIIDSRTAAEIACEASDHGPHPPNHECDYVPSNVQEFNGLYEECFGVRIIEGTSEDSPEKFEQLDTVDFNNRPQGCEDGIPDTAEHLTTSQAEAANDLRIWRFYIADTVTGHSIACFEGIDSSCDLFGFPRESASTANPLATLAIGKQLGLAGL